MSITTIIGPMFSGKTSELIRLIDREVISGKKCLIIKNKIDDRYDSESKPVKHLTTHNNYCYTGCEIEIHTELNLELERYILEKKYEAIAIDEGHFFENLTVFCNNMANNGVKIFVSTLCGSYRQHLFEEIGRLLPYSENIIFCDSICMVCKNPGSFTIRITDSEDDIDVGGNDKYMSACRKCLNAFNCKKASMK